MADDEINQQEWDNPENWINRQFLGIYHSRVDSRLWVPKPNPRQGWTINFGHRCGWACFLGFTGGIVLLVLAIWGMVALLITN